MTERLLLFLAPGGGVSFWLLLQDGVVAARGEGLADLPVVRSSVLVVPGEEVTLQWLDLPLGLAPAQAQAAARLMAAEASAQPLTDMHVVAGREGEPGALRPVALAPAKTMERWLAAAAAAGVEPELVIPDTALLPVSADGYTRLERKGLSLWRGPAAAFAAEAELAALVVGDARVTELDAAAFEAHLLAALDRPLVNLRQGLFARRRAVRLEIVRVRRLGWLVLALALATLLLQITQIIVYTVAADGVEEETRRIAAAALSRSPGSAGAGDLDRRLTELRGGGVGFGAIAGAVFAAVQAVPNVELAALAFGVDGTLRIAVRADSPATLDAFAQRVGANGFAVERTVPRIDNGRQVQDMVVRAR